MCMFIAEVHVTNDLVLRSCRSIMAKSFGKVDEGSVDFCEILKCSVIHCEPQSEKFCESSRPSLHVYAEA